MGNHYSFSCTQLSKPSSGKIILSNGSVQEFNDPLTVAELMLEHPQHVVVDFHSAVTGKKPAPLPADKKLATNNVYLMLPIRRGKIGTLSAEEIHRLVLIVNSVIRSSSFLGSLRFLPWFARICHADHVAPPCQNVINVGEFCETHMKKDNVEIDDEDEFMVEGLEARPEYLSRQLSGEGWKPNLDTIKEKKAKKKVFHWLF